MPGLPDGTGRMSLISTRGVAVRYGGNTTCIEVRTESGALIILDAGTGIHPLACHLLDEMPLSAGIFISHTHWDHIQGNSTTPRHFAPDAMGAKMR